MFAKVLVDALALSGAAADGEVGVEMLRGLLRALAQDFQIGEESLLVSGQR
jgi:hypothetical protein